MANIKVQEVQKMCPYKANREVRQCIYDRRWKKAIKEIEQQIIEMNQEIIILEEYKRFLNNLKDQ